MPVAFWNDPDGRKLHDAGTDLIGDMNARKTRTAIVEHARDVAVAQVARLGVSRIDPERLAAVDLLRDAFRRGVHLAVQARGGLVRREMQRMARGEFRAEPLGGLQPHRMTGAVVVAEACDGG